MDHALWQRLQPLLDRAFDLEPAARADWLARLREESPDMAEELERLLAREGTLDRRGFLDTPSSLDPLLSAALTGATASVQRDQLAAALAPNYRIETEAGRGGMATVFRARDIRHGRDVAIKVIRPDAASVLGADRFLAEIRLTASLTHPNILPLLDSGQANGALYYVMPFIDGESLRARLRREGALSVDDARRLLRVVLEALDHAHQRGLVHRDIKPDNILVSGRQAWVADFGIAKAIASSGASVHVATSVGVTLGSPGYMSPEQIEGASVIDARADLYAVGVMAWEMIVGRPPFTADSMQQLFMKHLTAEPEVLDVARPGLPAGLSDVIMRALAKRADDRWPSAMAMLEALDGLETRSVRAAATTAKAPRPARRRVAVSLAVTIAVVGGAWWLTARRPALNVSRPERLTSVVRVEQPRLSPGGQWLAWLGGEANEFVFVQRIDSGGPRRLATVSPGLLAWLDDSTIAIAPRDSVPTLIDLRDGARVPNDWMQPRGGMWRRVAGSIGTLWNVRRSTADTTRLTLTMASRGGPGDSVHIALAPGEQLAWATGSLQRSGLLLATLAADSTLRLQRVARDRSPDTVLVVAPSDTSGIRSALTRFAGFVPGAGRTFYGFLKRDTLLEIDLRARHPEAKRIALDVPGVPSDMSADGDMIVPSLLNTTRLHRFPIPPDPARRAEIVMQVSGVAAVDAVLSPDGALIASIEALPATRRTTFYLQRPDGTARRELMAISGSASGLRWSPDGTKLAARVYGEDRPASWAVIDTRTATISPVGPQRDGEPTRIAAIGHPAAWSADSRTLFVTESEREAPRVVRQFTLAPGDTGRVISRWWEIQDMPRPEGLALSPDGTQLAVGGESLVALTIASGATRVLVPPRAETRIHPLGWTSAGEIQFVIAELAGGVPGSRTMYSVPATGGAPRLHGTLQAQCRFPPHLLASATEGACADRDQTMEAYRIRGFR